MLSAAGITRIGHTSALPHVGDYSNSACGLGNYPTHSTLTAQVHKSVRKRFMPMDIKPSPTSNLDLKKA
jgi:hypothetical protein